MQQIDIMLINRSTHKLRVNGSYDKNTKTLTVGGSLPFEVNPGFSVEHFVCEVPSMAFLTDETTFVAFQQYFEEKDGEQKRKMFITPGRGLTCRRSSRWKDIGRPFWILEDDAPAK